MRFPKFGDFFSIFYHYFWIYTFKKFPENPISFGSHSVKICQKTTPKSVSQILRHHFCAWFYVCDFVNFRLLGINFIMHDIDPDVTILKFNAQGNKLLTTLLHEFQRRGPSLVAEQKQGITLTPTNMQKFRKWISRSKTTNLWIFAPTPPSFNTTPLHLKMTNLSTQHNYAASNHHQACHQQWAPWSPELCSGIRGQKYRSWVDMVTLPYSTAIKPVQKKPVAKALM